MRVTIHKILFLLAISVTAGCFYEVNTTNAQCDAVVPSDHWKGEYFNNLDLSGHPLLVRDDGDGFINFEWPAESPSEACGVGIDTFSVRWTRSVFLPSWIYRFLVTSDDGFRLYIDDELKIDRWFDQPPTTHTVDVPLTTGFHTIRFEYFENTGGATARLSWDQSGHTAGVDYSPFRDGQDPNLGIFPTPEEIFEDMGALSNMANVIRTYSTIGVSTNIVKAASQHGLLTVLGTFISDNLSGNTNEINQLIAQCNDNDNVMFASVGSEAILRSVNNEQQGLSKPEVISLINQVRTSTSNNIPVTTGEHWFIWENHPDLVDAVDLIFVNVYGYWDQLPIEGATDYIITNRIASLSQKYPGKRIIISETGWPTAGESHGAAVPSTENQEQFIKEFIPRAREQNLDFFLFEAFDEAWKAEGNGVGPHWGFYNSSRVPKHTLTTLIPFADLMLTKTTPNPTLCLGCEGTYSITVTNKGLDAATGVTVVDPLPENLSFQFADASQGNVVGLTNIVWLAGDLQPGSSASATLNVLANAFGVVINTATVLLDQIDPLIDDNISSVETTVAPGEADLSLEFITSSVTSTSNWLRWDYSMAVTNQGPATAVGVVVTNTIPSGFTIDTSSSCDSISATQLICELGELQLGSSIDVTNSILGTPTSRELTNQFSVAGMGVDPNAANNESSLIESLPDTDIDGIPDWWTQAWFGHPDGQDVDESQANDDPDGDGLTNQEEFEADSNPLDPTSRFQITGLSLASPIITITFTTPSIFRDYLVESTDLIESNSWSVLLEIPEVTSNFFDAELMLSLSDSKRFYRVQSKPIGKLTAP